MLQPDREQRQLRDHVEAACLDRLIVGAGRYVVSEKRICCYRCCCRCRREVWIAVKRGRQLCLHGDGHAATQRVFVDDCEICRRRKQPHDSGSGSWMEGNAIGRAEKRIDCFAASMRVCACVCVCVCSCVCVCERETERHTHTLTAKSRPVMSTE